MYSSKLTYLYKHIIIILNASHRSLVNDGDQSAVGPGHQPPLTALGRVFFGLFGQGPPSALTVHDHRHLGYQVVLELAEHQIVLHFVARGDAVADVIQVVQQVVRQVHVGDALLGDARQLGFIVGSAAAATTASAATAAASATTATAAASGQETRGATAAHAAPQQSLQTLQRRLHDHHLFGFHGERQPAPLRTRVGHAQLLGAGLVVLVPGHVAPVQIDEEHGQTAQQHARGAEVITRLGAVTDVNVTCAHSVRKWLLYYTR